MSRVAALVCTLAFASAGRAAEPPKTPVGLWEGPVEAGPVKVTLALAIAEKDGKLTAALTIADQGLKNHPADVVAFADGKLTAEFKTFKAKYAGTLAADGKSIKGTWTQGTDHPLNLNRVEKLTAAKRPQEPKKPYPYDDEDVAFDNPAGKNKLAGTFTKPKGAGPFPAVALISGSGPQDRDETLLGHKPFLVWADYLTRQGIAVLRYDDRGVGKSTGDYAKAVFADFVTDADAAVEYLKTRKDVDPKRIGLMGHSEGGMIAPAVAAKSAGVAFIVLLAGPGTPCEQILIDQSVLLLKAAGADEKTIEWQRKLQRRMLDLVKEGAEFDKIQAAIEDSLAAADEKLRKVLDPIIKAAVAGTQEKLTSPWLRNFVRYDPRPALAKVKCPVLAVNGEKDLQVPSRANLDGIAKALKDGGNADATVKEFAGLNHLFQKCKTGGLGEYATIEETVNPDVLAFVAGWIGKRESSAGKAATRSGSLGRALRSASRPREAGTSLTWTPCARRPCR